MARWGRRGKANRPIVVPQALPNDAVFGASRAPRSAPVASSTPLADQLSTSAPGVTEDYVVLPRSLAQDMPLPWQHQLAGLLARFHELHRDLSWPAYQVVPSRPERLTDLDEDQLAGAGYLVELESDGELVYRDRRGRRVDDPGTTVVLVPCLDPIVRRNESSGDPNDHDGDDAAAGPEPVPMNIGPQPVWRTTTTAHPTPAPALPAPPTAPPRAVPAAPGSQEPTEAVGARDGRGWFDEMAGTDRWPSRGPSGTSESEKEEAAPEPGPEFGPTGDEPTQIPYRYRR